MTRSFFFLFLLLFVPQRLHTRLTVRILKITPLFFFHLKIWTNIFGSVKHNTIVHWRMRWKRRSVFFALALLLFWERRKKHTNPNNSFKVVELLLLVKEMRQAMKFGVRFFSAAACFRRRASKLRSSCEATRTCWLDKIDSTTKSCGTHERGLLVRGFDKNSLTNSIRINSLFN